MNRLIDTDKLWKDTTSNIDYCEEFLEIIEKQETIKAIPEEWINDHVAWLESMDADVAGSDARAIRVMLTKWKMEQENAGGCSADACPIKF